MRGMKLLRVDYRLWIAGAVLLLFVGAFYLWAFTQNRPSPASQQLIELRNDFDRKLADYVQARDEYDKQLEADANGQWDDPKVMQPVYKKLAPLKAKVEELERISDEALKKVNAADMR
jgi:hypothetical protein